MLNHPVYLPDSKPPIPSTVSNHVLLKHCRRLKSILVKAYLKLGKTDLQRMLVLSTCLHVLVLAVKFVPEQLDKIWENEALQVVLVNTIGDTAPNNAQALANANLLGGGEADDGMVTSPLPNMEAVQDGESLEELQKQVKNLEAVQSSLLSILKGKADINAPSGTAQEYNPEQGKANNSTTAQIKREIAALDKEIQDYNKRPKRAQLSIATREASFATYYALWSDRTERLGTEYYVEAARGKSAEVIVTVSVRADGSLEGLVLERSSGNKAIDNGTLNLLKRLAPYPRFKGTLKDNVDVLDITTKLVFTPANTLTTVMKSAPPR
jgi:periplasmic protein TonB